MPLFDNIARSELRTKNEAEATFTYYNTSARPSIQAMRAMLEQWFDRVPDDAKKDVAARYQSTNEPQHQAAFSKFI